MDAVFAKNKKNESIYFSKNDKSRLETFAQSLRYKS